jgi:NAD(P)-dependent dehydrogenase (short-subunit alcohol dehydrogenase family)
MVEILSVHSPKMLILASRTPSKIQDIIEEWKSKSPSTTYVPVALDLSSQKSVREAAASILSNPEIQQIDIVFNNAAVMAIPERQLSPDGIEMQFATNHIGHFLFTNLIMPKIVAAAKSNVKGATRIINVSSLAAFYGPVRFSDINFDKPNESLPEAEQPGYEALAQRGRGVDPKDTYNPQTAYGQSKSANVLFSLALTARLYEKYGILSFGLHPGGILTELSRYLDPAEFASAVEQFKGFFVSVDQGCATSLRAGLDDSLGPANYKTDGQGIYLADVNIAEAPAWAHDPKLAERLWELSEKLVGQKFDV